MNGFEDREERQAGFDTRTLLAAVNDLDLMREHLEGEGTRPPEMRDDLLRLHQLAMRESPEDADEAPAGEEGLLVGVSGWFTPQGHRYHEDRRCTARSRRRIGPRSSPLRTASISSRDRIPRCPHRMLGSIISISSRPIARASLPSTIRSRLPNSPG